MWRTAILVILAMTFSSPMSIQSQDTKVSARDPSLPEGKGVYCRKGTESWIRLEQAVLADSKAHGLGNFIDTNGMTRLNVTLAYKGPQAAVQISASKPTFFARGIGSAREALIIQLTRKRDNRETKIDSTEATFDNKMGFKRGEIHRVTTSPVSRTAFTLTPDEDLKPGEYLLVLGNDDAVFDFGILSAKQ